ncbi:sulfotransferase [Sphingomonas sp. KRR8]|uniref:sulfotransferase family protein n=1 Tax=Sphingomonas sp. KRR8 TaxID=2942996 RepID=UPI002021C61F|nr:sulfotransferase [Sphingomonas sp. KRR8]URD59683.1 sulfotransferase [Sphingomonas sp. KRR8]
MTATPARRWPPLAAIVGAPRCGTTSLANYLMTHPAVTFSSPKEPHYFTIFDLDGLGDAELRETVEQGYLDRFFGADWRDAELLMEGSVSYLFGADKLKPLLRLWPDARFIIAVRDPMTMLPSLHQRYLVTGDETATSFVEAWQLVPERAAGRRIPASCLDPRMLRYDIAGRLGDAVEHFFDVVGRERCHVVVHDDLISRPADVYAGMLNFLDLPHDGRTDFPPMRAAAGVRWHWLQRLLQRPPLAKRLLAGRRFRAKLAKGSAKPTPAPVTAIMRARKQLIRFNEVPASKPHLDHALRQQLHEAFAADTAKLGRLIGRDLSHWLAVEPAGEAKPRRA